MRAAPQPVVAALGGVCAGAGAILAMASDLRIGTAKAKIAFLFVRVGLSGADMGAAWLLPRLVGHGRASELLMTGDFIEADEAYRIGLYNHVVAEGTVVAEAQALAARLAAGPQFAIELTKDALNREADMDLTGAIEAESQLQAALMTHLDFHEAYEALRAKRPPRFV